MHSYRPNLYRSWQTGGTTRRLLRPKSQPFFDITIGIVIVAWAENLSFNPVCVFKVNNLISKASKK